MNTNIQQLILNVGKEEIETVVHMAVQRYEQLYPDWEIAILSIEKKENRNAQIDGIMELLEKMKEPE